MNASQRSLKVAPNPFLGPVLGSVWVAAFWGFSFCCFPLAFGLATEEVGPPLTQGGQPEWPKGTADLTGHPSGVYSSWVNGNETFYFQATPDQINQLLSLFSRIRMRDYEVWIKPPAEPVETFGGKLIDFNVSVHVPGGIYLGVVRESDNPEEMGVRPRLTIHISEESDPARSLTIPDNVHLHSEIAFDRVNPAKPIRKPYYGQVQFQDGSPAADFEHGVSTNITWWDKDHEDGIEIADVDHKGYLLVWLSDQELESLNQGESWLTMTMGNYLVTAQKVDERFPPEKLAAERDNAQPVQIPGPQYLYGRVLFEDGSPPVLDPEPWPGAKVSVSLPFGGHCEVDETGYFKIYMTAEQFKEATQKKEKGMVYSPEYGEGNTSKGKADFPFDLLASQKADAGVVRIARPPVPEGWVRD